MFLVDRSSAGYNIFVATNIQTTTLPEDQISKVLSLIGQPARIQILLVIHEQEACVCHLEAVLHARQASISQHLMVLRKAGLVTAHREGRNIFYRLAQPGVVAVLQQAALLAGIDYCLLQSYGARPVEGCPCPQCNPGMDPNLTCQNARESFQPPERYSSDFK